MHGALRCAISTLTLLLAFGAPARAADPAATCQASKLLRAGKLNLCLLKELARAVRGSGAADYAKCDAKFAAAWSKAEAKAAGACPTANDATTITGQVTGDVAAILAALSRTSSTTTSTTIPSGPPCGGGVWPGCGGSCPAGSTCWATIPGPSTQTCTCLPAVTTPCADSGGFTVGDATCGGACPAGEVCTTLAIDDSTFSATCGCIPAGATPCVSSGQPACGGACPAGLTCEPAILFPCGCQ